ncbi:MAG: response regulator [Pseudomonadota bacterium]
MGDLIDMKVLLVDDDPSIRTSMEYYFRKKTAVFKTVESAELGIEILRDIGPVDIFIVDYKLPGMNGLSFLKVAKQKWPNARCVLITAHSSPEIISKAFKVGVNTYIQKPFTTATMKDALRKA